MQDNYSEFNQIIDQILDMAKEAGATDAVANVSASEGLSVKVRKGDLETVEHMRSQGAGIKVYIGKKSGSASTNDLGADALRQSVLAAVNIARQTAEDEAAGLPDKGELAVDKRDLQLYKPWDIDASQAQSIALATEQAALDYDSRISNSDGATVGSYANEGLMGNSLGFRGGSRSSSHSISASVIAGQGTQMQSDYWYDSNRYPERLASPESIGQTAARRTVARLNPRRIKTGKYRVLFEAPLAISLLGNLSRAISGSALYRKVSFLDGSLDKQIFPDHIQVLDDPFVPGAAGSSWFDDEGVQTHKRQIVQNGTLRGFLLSTYSARKMGMKTTGNAGGSHNFTLSSSLGNGGESLQDMLKKLDRGILLTDLIGQGVNYVTGDYSRGAFGYWVENGEIQYPLEEFTVAGNLKDMFMQIQAVGGDAITRGAKTTGSILLEQMAVAGS